MKRNPVYFFHEVAEKVKEIKNCNEAEFKQKVLDVCSGMEEMFVSEEYLEPTEKYRTCTVSSLKREDVYVSMGIIKKDGKISVVRSKVHASLDVLLDSETFTKVIHVSHDDLDGESPQILSRFAFADKELITRGCHYDKVDEIVMNLIRHEMDKERTILFITDISVSSENLATIHELVQEGYRILMFDHHDVKPEVPVKKYQSWMSIDQTYPDGRGTAATSIYYEFLVKQGFLSRTPIMDDYVELVRLYDTWEWEDEVNLRAKRLNDYFFMTNREEFNQQVSSRLVQGENSEQFLFDFHIEYMMDMEQKRIDDYCNKKKRQLQIFKGLVDGTDYMYRYGVVFAETYQSELENYLCKEFIDEMDFVVMIDSGAKKMSLRCNKHKPIDVGAIARSVGGGGRPATAGCPLNTKTKYLFVDRIMSRFFE
ncbi:DHH family phosphoesterase [Brevibacillus sp. NPDC058079]|uniref:DHH family phosphoesterase n=1 Tax=Brevibacillus sp. NPDC058079 TaxID=3346330 RepID=UPI0036E253C1